MINYKQSKGFTLVELMVSVGIVTILAMIALPAYNKYTVKAQISEGLRMADEVKLKVVEYYNQNGSMPPNNASIYWTPTAGGKYVSGITVHPNGLISVKFGPNANKVIQSEEVPGDPPLVQGQPYYQNMLGQGFTDQKTAIDRYAQVVPQSGIDSNNCYIQYGNQIVCASNSGGAMVGYKGIAPVSCDAGEMIVGGKCVADPGATMAESTGTLELTPTPDGTGTVKWGCTMTIDMAYIPSGCTYHVSNII
jgi:type IV pilus assembly protein PilA